jgi:hypothetical protein
MKRVGDAGTAAIVNEYWEAVCVKSGCVILEFGGGESYDALYIDGPIC